MPKKSTLVFVGRSNSGKGTQVELLQPYLLENDVLHFESGARFREFIKKDGYTNERMKVMIGSGNLAPDFITEWLLVDELVKDMDEEKTLILDGFPRTIPQAMVLDSAMDYYKRNQIMVINIEVSEEEVRRRAAERGRTDDVNQEALNRRMDWYRENVLPMLKYLRDQKQYHVIDIDGEQSVEGVHESIIKALSLTQI